MAYTALAYSCWVSTMHMNAYVMPTNDIDYNCHIKAIELINQSYRSISHHMTSLVINSLGGGHTHARIQTFAGRSNSKKPDACLVLNELL